MSALLLAGLPAAAQTPTDPGPDEPVGAGEEGFVFGDRSMLPPPGETPTGREIVDQRTATSRTYETSVPGVLITQQHAAPINAETADGWEPIDPTFEPDDDGYTNAVDRIDVAVAPEADADELGSVSLPSGASVGFGIAGTDAIEADVDGAIARYHDALDGVDVVLQSLPGGLKETLRLASADAASEFVYDLTLDSLSAQLEPDGSVSFVNAAGVAKLTIPPGFMVDAVGARSDAVSYTLSPDGTSMVVTADQGWLADPTRVFPVEVDPTLSVVADADDTFVSQGITPGVDQSSSQTLKVGFDGTRAHRSFLHFTGPSTMAGMNVLAADLALWQSGSGSCTASPVDIYAATETWVGSTTTLWPGPATGATPSGSITSGKGYDASCAAGAVGTDLTRQVDAWVQGETPSLGIGLRARDESAASQYKTFVSADGDGIPAHRPVLNVLWSDPTQAGAPFDPTGLAPEGHTDEFDPTFEAAYLDPDGDDGYVVFFGYIADTGAFAGAILSPTIDSGETAQATGYLPLDFPLTWRAQAVDAVHQIPSYLSPHVSLLHPSVRITSPTGGDSVDGVISVIAEVDPSITDVTSVELSVDANPAGSSTAAPHHLSLHTDMFSGGTHTLTATIDGGLRDGQASPPVPFVIDNSDDGSQDYNTESTSPVPAGNSPTLQVWRMAGVTDDVADGSDRRPVDPIDSGTGDCGYSEPMPNGYVLWFVCDGYGFDSVVGIAPDTDPASPAFQGQRLLGEPAVANCPPIDGEQRDFRWMTGVTSYPGQTSAQTIVAVFFLEGCRDRILLGRNNPDHDSGNTGVATFVYNTSAPATISAATVHSSNLWDGKVETLSRPLDVLHGDGAVYLPTNQPQVVTGDRGYVYTYACLQGLASTRHSGYCTVARAAANPADPSTLGQRANWQYYTGHSDPAQRWVSCGSTTCGNEAVINSLRDAQIGLRLPGTRIDLDLQDAPTHPNGLTCRDGTVPPCLRPSFAPPMHFQVSYSPTIGAYISVSPRSVLSNELRLRVAADPVGPWSAPIDVPMACNAAGLNCYQIGASPEITSGAGTVFHYYDRYGASDNPNVTPRPLDAIRFLAVPLCVRSRINTGEGTAVNYVVRRCWMTDGKGWSSTDTVERREAAAIIWRLAGRRPHASDATFADLNRVADREPVSFVVDPAIAEGFHRVWSNSTGAFNPGGATTRGDFIRLLHLVNWEAVESATPPFEDWAEIEGTGLRAALRWAHANGITCATSFQPTQPLRRSTAANWIRRAKTGIGCTGTEAQ